MFLVTGATGTIGSNVVRELRGSRAPIRALVRDPSHASWLGDDFELALGDFADPDSIRRALDGIERVFLSCRNDPRQVEYETNVIDAAVAAGVRRIVKLSAVGAQIGSPLEFWDAHGRIEQHLKAAGVPAVILRPSSYMSNILGSAEAIKYTGKLFAPADSAKIAMIDPRDVAAVAALVLSDDGHDGHTYTLTGPQAITYFDVAEQLSAAIGREVEFVDVPDEAAKNGLVQAGMPEWIARQLVILFGLMRQGALAHTTDTVRVLTGRDPRSFTEFARDHAAIFAS
jgi:uncharacterized protein YbjT (DUF2867 family)